MNKLLVTKECISLVGVDVCLLCSTSHPIPHIMKSFFRLFKGLLVMDSLPRHISILFQPIPDHSPNALIQVTKSLLIIKSKVENCLIGILCSAAFDSVDYFLLETLHYLGRYGNPLSQLFATSFSLLPVHTMIGSSNVIVNQDSACSILSLVISLILKVPITL